MRLEIDIPEHHYNNIMAIDSVSLGRAPYKGIIMYAINAIKQGKVLEQEPKTDVKLTNSEWIDFLCKQFDISRTSAKQMLHVMMSVKKEDNFKKQFSGRKWVNFADDLIPIIDEAESEE